MMGLADLIKEYKRQRIELEHKLALAVEESDWEGIPSMQMTDIQSQIIVVKETIEALARLEGLMK